MDKVVGIEPRGVPTYRQLLKRPQLLQTRPTQAQKRHLIASYGRISRRRKFFMVLCK